MHTGGFNLKTLILSCNTGEGHNSCAKAIKEYYDKMGEECLIADGLEFISPTISKIISDGHSFIYRHVPWLFKVGYKYAESHPMLFRKGSAVHRLFTKRGDKIQSFIDDGGFDSVICTHVFTALMLTDAIKNRSDKPISCFVATDYTCSPSTKESNLDYYFIPDSDLIHDFECENITEEKLVSAGIPIRQAFYSSVPIKEAKESLGIDPTHKHLVLMCGSMGCGPMNKILERLSDKLNDDVEISVVCGNNSKLEKKLTKHYYNRPSIHVRGFVKDMSTMMDSADLFLTKPGGISVSEASVKKLPMVLIDAVAGCEEYNRSYFLRKGGAKTGSSVDELVELTVMIINNDEKRKKMKESLMQLKKCNTAERIYQIMSTFESASQKQIINI